MKYLGLFLPTAVAVATALAGGDAVAASSAFAQLKDLTATLTDTNLHDGIVPSLVFTSQFDTTGQSRSQATASVFQDFTTYGFDQKTGNSPFSNVASSTQYGASSADAFVTVGSTPGGPSMSLTASGSAAGGPASQYFATASMQNPSDAQIFYRLSGHTSVTFSGIANVSSTISSHNDGGTSAEVFLQSFGGVTFDNVVRTRAFAATDSSVSLSVNELFPNQPLHQSATQRLSVTVTNNGGTPFIGAFEAYASVQGASAVSPVPEPQSRVLMLCGLVVVTFATRLKHTRQRLSDNRSAAWEPKSD